MTSHVFTEDQNTMEWYIDGIPVAELKRRYEAYPLLVESLTEAMRALEVVEESSNLVAIAANNASLTLHTIEGKDLEVRNG